MLCGTCCTFLSYISKNSATEEIQKILGLTVLQIKSATQKTVSAYSIFVDQPPKKAVFLFVLFFNEL